MTPPTSPTPVPCLARAFAGWRHRLVRGVPRSETPTRALRIEW
jgi:hypothetical protein